MDGTICKLDIRSPGELKKTLDMARKCVAAGILAVLREEDRSSQPFDQASSRTLAPDEVNVEFPQIATTESPTVIPDAEPSAASNFESPETSRN
ncbi:MAG: hypothetical protein AB1640_19995 [bacterium]